MLSKPEYIQFYLTNGKCIDQIQKPKNKLNEKQLDSKYANYIKKEERKINHKESKVIKGTYKDTQWEETVAEVKKRDNNICQLLDKLPKAETLVLKANSNGLHNIIDPAHILNKAVYVEVYYDPDAIVLLNRYSHSMLDQSKNPITGEDITQRQIWFWWKFIYGEIALQDLFNKYNIHDEYGIFDKG